MTDVVIQVKDYAYSASDPRHFGRYSQIESGTDSEPDSELDAGLDREAEAALVRAVSLYAFEPENGNELALQPQQVVYVNETQDLGGWVVAHDVETGATGLVPRQYVHIYNN